MPCKPLQSVNFYGLTTPREVLKKLDEQLLELATIAGETDFADAGQVEQFMRNIVFVKGYFERFERLVRDQAT